MATNVIADHFAPPQLVFQWYNVNLCFILKFALDTIDCDWTCDGVVEAYEAAEDGRQVPDESNEDTDAYERKCECQPSAGDTCGRQ